jgi:hypothetical protein
MEVIYVKEQGLYFLQFERVVSLTVVTEVVKLAVQLRYFPNGISTHNNLYHQQLVSQSLHKHG